MPPYQSDGGMMRVGLDVRMLGGYWGSGAF